MEGEEDAGENCVAGRGDNPQNKEETVDDEESKCSVGRKEKVEEENKVSVCKLEEKSEDEGAKLVVSENTGHKQVSSESVSNEHKETGRNEKKEIKEDELSKDLPQSLDESKSNINREVTETQTNIANNFNNGLEEGKEDLQNISLINLTSQEGNQQIPQNKTVPRDAIKNSMDSSKEETSIDSDHGSQRSSVSESESDKKGISTGAVPKKTEQSADVDTKMNQINKGDKSDKEVLASQKRNIKSSTREVKSSVDLKQGSREKSLEKTQEGSMSTKELKPNSKSMSPKHRRSPSCDKRNSIQENKTPNHVVNKTQAKTTNDDKKQQLDKNKGIQDKRPSSSSTSSGATKSPVHKTSIGNKPIAKSSLKIDSKPVKSKSMELTKVEKETGDKKLEKKQPNANLATTSTNRLKSPRRKESLETSKQKSASTGMLNKSVDSPQTQNESPICTTQDKVNKTKQEHAAKDLKTQSPVRTQPVKNSDKSVVPKGSQNSRSVSEKPVTTYQETVPSSAKCEEKLQRTSTIDARKNQDRMNKITTGITDTTEAAINEQFKQLEKSLPQELSVQNKTVPKQIPKSPTRRQPQQKTQKLTPQQKNLEQKQNLQRQPSPKKQKPAKSPTRRQPPKHIQQAHKELAQPKLQTTQSHATNLSKQEKQQVEIGKSQLQRKEQTQSEQKMKLEVTNQTEQNASTPKPLDNTEKPKLGETKQEKCEHMKESQDKEEKDECEHLTQQPSKHIIEQINHQQKQREKEAALAKHTREHKEQPDQKDQKETSKHQLQQQSEDADNDNGGGCGIQGKNCPIYFGVKSYLHHFYDSTPVKNSQLYEYIEEDDFEYAVDPVKNRGCRRCCRGFWFRAGLWGGINLILVGVITLLVGYLTPQREMVVGHHNNLEILDRSAIAFNRRLELCRLAGLAVFCCGGLVLLLTLLLSTFLHVGSHNNNNSYCCGESGYYGYVATSLVEPFIASPSQTLPVSTGIKIPITEQIKSVQPTLWPDIATVKDGTLVPHMP